MNIIPQGLCNRLGSVAPIFQAIRNLDTFTKNGSTLHLYETGGMARIFARTKNWTVQPYVYTGPTELDEFLNGQVCKFGNCFFQVSNLQKNAMWNRVSFLSVRTFVRTRAIIF